MKRLTPRLWCTLVLVGVMGQFAWTIENTYFNVYLYNTISTDPRYIAAMLAASAVMATLTTFLMGALSDRLGKRKAFICGGYLLWGVSTAAFGLITVDNAARLFPAANAVAASAILVIVMDCVMTFFGSTANDAAFNAYVTDIVPNDRRGRVESVLAILPLFSLLVIFGGFDAMTQAGRWRSFFLIFGSLVTATGIACVFLMREAPLEPQNKPYMSQLLYGFRPSVIREHGRLYLSLLALCLFSIAAQVFSPYLVIYVQHYLLMNNYALALSVVLVLASAVSVLGGRMIDRVGKLRFSLPAALVMLSGLVGVYFARGMFWVVVAGTVMKSGDMLLTAALFAKVRELTPPAQAGHFQGIRMIFSAMLPMIIGPAIGAAVIRGSAATYVVLGQSKTVPTPAIFLAASLVLLLAAIPVWLLQKQEEGAEAGERDRNAVCS